MKRLAGFLVVVSLFTALLLTTAWGAGPTSAGAGTAKPTSSGAKPTSSGTHTNAPRDSSSAEPTTTKDAAKPDVGAAATDPKEAERIVAETKELVSLSFPKCAKAWTEDIAEGPLDPSELRSRLKEYVGIGQKLQASNAQRKKLADLQQCGSSRLVLCLDQDGKLDPSETDLPKLTPKETVTVVVLGWMKQVDVSRLHVTFSDTPVNESLLAQPAASGDGGTDAGGQFLAADTERPVRTEWCIDDNYKAEYEAKRATLESRGGDATALIVATSPPAAPDDIEVGVVFRRDAASPADGGVPHPDGADGLAVQRHMLEVDPGRYFVDLGVMVPFTIDRRVVAVADVVTGQQRLASKYDARIIPAFVINTYPFGGRARGRISSFGRGRGSWASNFFGVQAGVGLDFVHHAFEEFYLGLLLTPFSGASLSLGVAVVNEQIFPKGASPDMILAKGATFTPDKQFMPYPYVGLSVTLDLFDIIRSGYSSLAGNAPPKK